MWRTAKRQASFWIRSTIARQSPKLPKASIIGKNDGVAYLVNDDNFDRTVEIKGIEPNDEGVVYIEMKPGPNNVQWAKFFGVNTMVLSEE